MGRRDDAAPGVFIGPVDKLTYLATRKTSFMVAPVAVCCPEGGSKVAQGDGVPRPAPQGAGTAT